MPVRHTDETKKLDRALSNSVDEVGGQLASGEVIGMSGVSIHRILKGEQRIALHDAYRIDRLGGDNVLRKWAEMQGYRLKPTDMGEPDGGSVHDMLCGLSKESSEAIQITLKASADGAISVNEARSILKALHEMFAAGRQIESLCHAVLARAGEGA
jgi:hypothetical protein